jgi:hypothetical protein
MAPPVGFQQALAESIDDFGGGRAVEVAAMMSDSVVICRAGSTTPTSTAVCSATRRAR